MDAGKIFDKLNDRATDKSKETLRNRRDRRHRRNRKKPKTTQARAPAVHDRFKKERRRCLHVSFGYFVWWLSTS